MKCIDEEIPFEIPESWGILRFDDFCFLKAGQFVSAQDIDIKYNQQLHPCYGGNGLRGYVKTYTHDGEFLLIGRQGALCGNVNYVSGRFHATEHAVVVQNFGSCINNKWLYYTLEAMNLNQYSAGAAQPGLNVGFLNKLRISIPPRIEQNRIVEKIEYTFALIDTINTDKEDLFQFVQTTKSKILDLAIRGKLVPQDPNDEPASTLLGCIKAEHPESKKRVSKTSDNSHYTFNIPKTWEWTTIGDITEHNTGKILDKGRNTGSLYKYITTSNLYWDYFLLDDLKEMPFEENELSKYSAIKGDLLICEGGDGGRSAIWNKDIPICFQNHIHRVRPFSGIRSRYIYFFMRYSSLNGYINYYKKGIGIQSLSGNSLSSIRLPLPPIPEQDRIINKIDDIFTSLDKITNSIKA